MYIVVQRGAARLEVVEIDPDLRTTVGRSPSNRVIVNDPKCSRQHCEMFVRGGKWRLRDLDSRNGVTIDGIRVDGEWDLEVGQTIGIGACALLFTDRRPDQPPPSNPEGLRYAVIERKSGTKYDLPRDRKQIVTHGRHGVAELFRLAQAMATAPDVRALTGIVLDGLLQGTRADVGGILLFPAETESFDARRLEPIAIHAPADYEHPRFSDYLSELVLGDHEALLAHDLADHAALSQRDSISDLAAESVICAPVRVDDQILGVIHLYSSNSSEPLDAEQLEFTLAVADQLGAHLVALRNAERLEKGISRVHRRNLELRQQLEVETELVGDSESLQEVRRAIARVAPTEATVLIRGESGVGKELVARAVHFNSERRDGPIVCVNCAALTESLLESELFGHEKGAFTGAAGQKAGKFEQAHGGTLFLDEIGEMEPELQAKFLRVLEGQAFERVGGTKAITADVRVVTATNRNLEEAVREGTFRSDLYFRLQVIEIHVPPLREHPEDIPEIVQHFVSRFARKSRVRVEGFTDEALALLQGHSWPGNVRELRNVIERAVILAESPRLTPSDITLSRIAPATRPSSTESPADRPTEPGDRGRVPVVAGDPLQRFVAEETTLDELDRLYLTAVLEKCDWNKSQAARILGIERTTLDRRLKRYDMRRPGEE